MALREFHRFRMQADLNEVPPAEMMLPEGYRWQYWDPALVERHALTKWKCFRSELDSVVFECLSNLEGCRRLMTEIARRKFFIPESTWLLVFQPEDHWPPEDVGTIQGVRRNRKFGAIQNVGITTPHRGRGLGRALLLKSLEGFRAAGVRYVYLEVTAENRPAVRLYRDVGFKIIKTMIKAVDVPDLIEI